MGRRSKTTTGGAGVPTNLWAGWAQIDGVWLYVNLIYGLDGTRTVARCDARPALVGTKLPATTVVSVTKPEGA